MDYNQMSPNDSKKQYVYKPFIDKPYARAKALYIIMRHKWIIM